MIRRNAIAFLVGLVTALAVVAGVLTVLVVTRSDRAAATEYTAVSPHEIADHFDVDVTYFAVSPCGDTSHVYGCWFSETPDLIWVSAEIVDPDLERWVVLHEIGHVMHHRLGVDGSECAADMFARSMLGEPPTEADWHC